MKDLTVGKPGKVLWQYSLPLFGSIIFQQLYNVADSFVAGRYIGTDALAAVGNAYEITLIFIAFAFGCNIGTSVITARYFGRKDYTGVRTTVHTALIASGALGVVLTLGGILFSGALLHMINTPESVYGDSLSYLNIYIGGFLFLLAYNISTGIFSALGDSKTPFVFLAVSSVSNVLMDILFVKTFHMGVNGVAWATFLCQGVSGMAALAAILYKLRTIKSAQEPKLFSVPHFKELLRVAVPSILQQGFISVGNIMIQSLINSFGTAAMGGYSAAIKLNNLTVTSVTALGNGMSNYTAQNMGAGRPERIKQGQKSAEWLVLGIAACFSVIYYVFRRPLVTVFISDGNADAIAAGANFMKIVVPFYFAVATKLIADGVLRGAGQMKMFMVATLLDLALRVAFSHLFSSWFQLDGVWMSWPVGWILSASLSVGIYLYIAKKNFYMDETAAVTSVRVIDS